MQLIDQTGHSIEVKSRVKRIVSLVPSLTELLAQLGLQKQLVGRTKFCIHPEGIKEIRQIGGTKNFKLEQIASLQPDLVIANKEENDKKGIEVLRRNYPVYTSDINSLKDAVKAIEEIGILCEKKPESEELVAQITKEFKRLPNYPAKTAIYCIWNNPLMIAGRGTFIDNMMQMAGFKNLSQATRYPNITVEELQYLMPDVLLLSSEPFPFNEKHQKYFADRLSGTKVIFVDGELFSWYGSRMKLAPSYFRTLQSQLNQSSV